MRILSRAALGFGNVDPPQRFDCFRFGLSARATVVEHVDVGELAPDGEDRIERSAGVLEHHADARAAELAHAHIV